MCTTHRIMQDNITHVDGAQYKETGFVMFFFFQIWCHIFLLRDKKGKCKHPNPGNT